VDAAGGATVERTAGGSTKSVRTAAGGGAAAARTPAVAVAPPARLSPRPRRWSQDGPACAWLPGGSREGSARGSGSRPEGSSMASWVIQGTGRVQLGQQQLMRLLPHPAIACHVSATGAALAFQQPDSDRPATRLDPDRQHVGASLRAPVTPTGQRADRAGFRCDAEVDPQPLPGRRLLRGLLSGRCRARAVACSRAGPAGRPDASRRDRRRPEPAATRSPAGSAGALANHAPGHAGV
jgi:hypothetical protein